MDWKAIFLEFPAFHQNGLGLSIHVLPLVNSSEMRMMMIIMMILLLECIWLCYRYGRWVTRRVAVLTIVTIWLLAALVSFVPISFSLHRPDQPLVFEDNGRQYLTCALDLTPTYAVVSSCISFYVPCIVMIGIYCRYGTQINSD